MKLNDRGGFEPVEDDGDYDEGSGHLVVLDYHEVPYTELVVEDGLLISQSSGTMRIRKVPQSVIDRVMWRYTGEPYVPQDQES